MLVTVKELLKKAEKRGYAVGSFNTPSLEVTKAIIAAAEKLKSPVIVSTSEGEINYAGLEFISKIVRIAASEAHVPVALNLDHGKSLKMALMCIAAGYTSVHIDGSALDYEDNVALTLAVTEVAHKERVSVEGELGHIAGGSQINRQKISDLKIEKTDSRKVKDFVKETNIDCLAPCIGNAHGIYDDVPKLDFDLLSKIRDNVSIPLVLHGGSGIPGRDIKKTIKKGIRKINVNTELRIAFTGSLRAVLAEKPDEVTPYKYFPHVIKTVEKEVEEKIKLFGSVGKA